jgi:hypothetical protein
VWLDLVGYDSITNHMHMVGAGHLRCYLRKWRKLNQFQNQGWESYNQFVPAFWHHQTTKGREGIYKEPNSAYSLLVIMLNDVENG